MRRQLFVHEEVWQPVEGFANAGAPVEVNFCGRDALAEAGYIVAGKRPAELGIEHVDNGWQGVRHVKQGKGGKEAKAHAVYGGRGDLQIARKLDLAFLFQRIDMASPHLGYWR